MSASPFLSVPARTVRRLTYSRKARVLLTAVALFDAAAITGLLFVFAPRIAAWQRDGVLDRRLWLLCLVSWIGTAGLSMLGTIQEGFGQKAILTFTLPVPSASRARILYAGVTYQLFNLWLIGVTALAIALGVGRLQWILLALAGHVFAVLAAMLLLFVFIRYLRRAALWIAVAAVCAGAFLLIRNTGMPASPLIGAGVFVALLILLLGPLAEAVGNLYARSFYTVQASSPRAVKRRYMSILTGWLLRSRTPGAALFVKDLLTRSRHWANWGRVLTAVAAVAAFPLLRAQLQARHIDDALLIIAFVMGGILLTIIDGISSPFGSEGNRLTLILTAPVALGRMARAKLMALVVPFALTGVGTAVFLALTTGLGREAALRIGAAVLLMTIGISTLFAMGSAFDVDLDLEVEGGLQGLMQEEAPLTPVRLALTFLGSLLFVAELVMMARLPWTAAYALLLIIDAVLLVAGYRVALTRFRQRVLRG